MSKPKPLRTLTKKELEMIDSLSTWEQAKIVDRILANFKKLQKTL